MNESNPGRAEGWRLFDMEVGEDAFVYIYIYISICVDKCGQSIINK